MTDLVERARLFATEAHASIGQKRKYDGQDYIVHPCAVAGMVENVGASPAAIAAAWLHDVVEDTPVTLADIEARFGRDVAALVEMLTDISVASDGNRATRKAIDRAHTARATPEGQTIKLADLIDNAMSITTYDPHFAVVFMREAALLLPLLDKGDRSLHARLSVMLDTWRAGRRNAGGDAALAGTS